MRVGIEALNVYVGQTSIDIHALFQARGLDTERFTNLMMHTKTVGLPCEDPVSNAVNAAKPLIDELDDDERNNISMVITATESGIDFGKSISTYVHDYLNLSNNCRLFEVKQACYACTAALQMAQSYVQTDINPDAKVLVVSTDIAREAARHTYAEPSQGVAAVALLVGAKPDILELDLGATGFYGREIMDTCRPTDTLETGDPDKSLLAYIECLEQAYQHYRSRVGEIDLNSTFDYFAFHNPFVGLVKSAFQRLLMLNGVKDRTVIDQIFSEKVLPSTFFGSKTGNSYSAAAYVSLASLLSNINIDEAKRIAIYSYGSGSCAEFFSGVITPQSCRKVKDLNIQKSLDERYPLTMAEYEHLLDLTKELKMGVQSAVIDTAAFDDIYQNRFEGRKHLVLRKIDNYHRVYDWS